MKTFKLLLQNLNETMPVETQLDKATKMGVIFINFTCIYSDRNEPVRKKKNEKLKGKSISKTSGRERVFKHKCFISNDSIYISSNLPYFYVKDRCKASMKKELRNARIQLCERTGEVFKARYSCSAGKSGYCNNVMALFYEITEYSLNQRTEVTQEKLCTSLLREWRVPENNQCSCKRNCHESKPN